MEPRDDVRRDLADRVLLHRRRFLGLVAAGAGTLVFGACSDDGEADGGPSGGNRRTSTSTTEPPEVPGAQGLTADPFTLGVASGDPLPDSVVLWTRLAPEPSKDGTGGMGSDDVDVLWEVASDEAFGSVVASGLETASGEFGHSVHAEPEGLEPDTWYHYRFRVGTFTSPVARTRTTPADGAEVDELRFGFVSCQLRSAGQWTAYDHLVEDRPDLVFHLGDYVYEYIPDADSTEGARGREVADLADYRLLYAAYKLDPKLQAAHHAAPWIVTWDDHEVENNYAGEVPQDSKDEAGFADRRRAAYQAFWEHHPVRLDPPADDGSLKIYRTLQYGSLARFLVFDGRQYRSDQVCGDTVPTAISTCPELGDEEHTMLGTEQEAWAAKELADGDAIWTVLAQQTVMKALVLGDLVLNVDQWDGYPAARARLLGAIDDAGIENVVVLTGDIHAGGAADIRSTDAGVKGKVLAHELVGPGISSQGLGAGLAESLDLESLGLTYANFADNGYVRCTVTPERWQAEFVVVDTIAEPTSDASVAATVRIAAGTPGMERV